MFPRKMKVLCGRWGGWGTGTPAKAKERLNILLDVSLTFKSNIPENLNLIKV